MDWKKLLGSISASVNEDLRLCNTYLVAENRILRQQINGRVQFTNSDRKALAEIGQKFSKQALEEIATVAKPDTILAWHRTFVDQQVDTSEPQKPVGRPRINQELVASFVNRSNLLKSWEKTDTCEGSAGGMRRPKNAAFTRIPIPHSATEYHAFF